MANKKRIRPRAQMTHLFYRHITGDNSGRKIRNVGSIKRKKKCIDKRETRSQIRVFRFRTIPGITKQWCLVDCFRWCLVAMRRNNSYEYNTAAAANDTM